MYRTFIRLCWFFPVSESLTPRRNLRLPFKILAIMNLGLGPTTKSTSDSCIENTCLSFAHPRDYEVLSDAIPGLAVEQNMKSICSSQEIEISPLLIPHLQSFTIIWTMQSMDFASVKPSIPRRSNK